MTMLSRRDLARLGAAGLLAPALASIPLSYGAARQTVPLATEYPMFGGNAAHTGEMPGPAPDVDAPIDILWEHRVRSSFIHPPIYADGVIYASSYPSGVQAIDAVSGEQLWRATFDGNVEDAPALLDGIIYVCCAESRNFAKDSVVLALDATSGEEKWRFTPGQEVTAAPCVWDGKVYVTSSWHLIHALDASSGDVVWSQDTQGQFKGSPAVSDGVVFAGGQDEQIVDAGGAMWAFDANTGAVQWVQYGRRWVGSTPVVRHGLVYVSCGDDYLYALDIASGNEQWRFEDQGAIRYTSPAVNEQTLIAAGPDGRLFGLDPATGAEHWRTDADRFWRNATPVIVDDTVFVPSTDDHLVAVDIISGAERWQFPVESPKPPVVMNGRIFVPGRDTLYALGNV